MPDKKSSKPSAPDQARPPRVPIAAFPTGTRVRVRAGMWADCVGVIHRLTESVGGDGASIVLVDPPAPGTKDMRFLPRTRAIIVDNNDLESAPRHKRVPRKGTAPTAA